MGVSNIYNDIDKGLYDLAINELQKIKKQNKYLQNDCDRLIDLITSYKIGHKKKYKKDWEPLIEKIINKI